ncbi:Tex family protein [Photobacterium damselae]|uniref:Tex family protein n=1 Tax=Photobacterium damselae TaxID=38293 RepID=UPI000D06B05B|nr:Tex family protein [Photobacterium damselae]KAB1180108.1 RNA-binding transcriptional accessory protein [Photobacterium damselae subsp. damselae]MBA5683971.1 RNA-binding transcriptional accessory protein [Photobacterium damselae subsp. damselae]MBF7099795.1 RNA-binding transcriptional accessory protein [Photobacterium damselae]NVO61142.1 RNA-binding transcriptional accessory protein [Photobacterium damselae subsp. damselae]NVO74099.1 RNA-binding transcriptional accessory protein [Photobacter
MNNSINQLIASELNVRLEQINAAVSLLDDGNTVPFVARYRKEVTGGLDDTQLRNLESRLGYLRELDDRRKVILKSISEQNKLTPQLEAEINQADSKTRLEDLYLPYKPKRRTKGQIAIEAGIEPLADLLWQHPDTDPEIAAHNHIDADKGFADTKAVLDGARAILMERFAEDAALLEKIRRHLTEQAELTSRVVDGKEHEGAKFKDYFEYSEKVKQIPSHRALALFRGRNEGFLQLSLNADPNQDESVRGSYCEVIIADHYKVQLGTKPSDAWRKQVISWAWRIKILMHMETELMAALRERAEDGAMQVFADNLKDLLMAAPAGPRVTLAIDPGLRTGSKIAVVDETGKLLDTATIYPHAPHNKIAEAGKVVLAFIAKYQVNLIAIGNGTASRETDSFVAQLIKDNGLKVQSIMVSEAGASVYSASELAANEFPNLDVSIRGAVSIGRRLQDPLAELVKIDPKSIGVGQYQHDVSQSMLAKRLDAVVEDCVNAVGVDVNTASAPLLTRVAGLNATIAQNIVNYRDENGRFEARTTLKKVARLGPKAFEQCAGFLRIMNGKNPLDGSAVHPESYEVVKRIASANDKSLDAIIGNSEFLRTLKAVDYTDQHFGLPTVTDIISELDKPGRDPRPEFKTATFAEGVNEVKDLIPGMILEGVITNVTNFGAFVDVGVHQDGLIHISALSDKFVSDPREVVKAGDIVKVKVMEVDLQRKRIGMSMRLNDEPGAEKPTRQSRPQADRRQENRPRSNHSDRNQNNTDSAFGGAFAAAFANAKKK